MPKVVQLGSDYLTTGGQVVSWRRLSKLLPMSSFSDGKLVCREQERLVQDQVGNHNLTKVSSAAQTCISC